MPVFTFEKISPPIRRVSNPSPVAAEKPRGVLTQLLDRFTDVRGKRKLSLEQARRPQPRKQAK